MKTQNNFRTVRVTSSNELDAIVRSEIQAKSVSHYLFINTWDDVCQYFNTHLDSLKDLGAQGNLFVIDVFDIPNGLGIIRSAIKDYKETMSTNSIQNYTKLPMMVRLHGAFPVLVDYNGSIAAEIGA